MVEDGQVSTLVTRVSLSYGWSGAGDVVQVDDHHPVLGTLTDHHHLRVLVSGAVEEAGGEDALQSVSVQWCEMLQQMRQIVLGW